MIWTSASASAAAARKNCIIEARQQRGINERKCGVAESWASNSISRLRVPTFYVQFHCKTTQASKLSRPGQRVPSRSGLKRCLCERESARHDTVNIYCNIFRFIISQRWRGSCHLRAPACCAPNESPGFLYAWRSDNKCNVKNRLIFLHMDFFLSHSHPAVGIYTRSERKNWRKRGSAACLL